jgi:dihydrofolate synthase/folylpolyglutamate synthase
MTYIEAVQWLYSAVPNFQRDGGNNNYKIGLEGPLELWSYLGHPARNIPTIHVAGTNGKGSTVHLMASGMREMGLSVGVFSSPHLFDFRERAKIGTAKVPEAFVADFISQHEAFFNQGRFSFFELTLMLALQWFEHAKVDWIILETGMGGRLDATNICQPELTLITNIGLDHVQWLGNTRAAIAAEKAGIIKPGVPAVVIEKDPQTQAEFENMAHNRKAPLFWASSFGFESDLRGDYQKNNINGAATALDLLFPEFQAVWSLGFTRVVANTGLQGRWMIIDEEPRTICDTGHNAHAFSELVPQAQRECKGTIHWVLGSAGDKDFKKVLELLPIEGSKFYWTGSSSPRTAAPEVLGELAASMGRYGNHFPSVRDAWKAAKNNAGLKDLIFIGGSTFVVADLSL